MSKRNDNIMALAVGVLLGVAVTLLSTHLLSGRLPGGGFVPGEPMDIPGLRRIVRAGDLWVNVDSAGRMISPSQPSSGVAVF